MTYSMKDKEFDVTGPDKNDPDACLLCAKPVAPEGLPNGQKYFLQLFATDADEMEVCIVIPNHDDQVVWTHYFMTETEAVLWMRNYMIDRYGAIARHIEFPDDKRVDWTEARRLDWSPRVDAQVH